ncbi:MAG: NusA-like transcription termination signal-binding factor [Candidatus Thermoplasmatota archaeon]|nr:NusA-like transcription termination signal-binding factor [Candidatus Thermoplasmatota archaeon]
MAEWDVISQDTLRCMQLFENVTEVRSKEILEEGDTVVFLVDKGKLGQAIGKGAHRLKKLEDLLNKKVKIVEFDSEERFIKNLFKPFPLTSLDIRDETAGRVAYVSVDPKDKGKAIGDKGKNLHIVKKLVKKYYNIVNVIVV